MASYEIELSDGSKKISIPENVIDKDTTSIALVGHGQPSYGKSQNENFVHMLENFASDVEPNMPIKGQLWFKENNDTDTYEFRICRQSATEINEETGLSDAVWDKILKTSISDNQEPQNPSTGDIWYDVENHQFKVFDSTLDPEGESDGKPGEWNTIGPNDVVHKGEGYDAKKTDYEQSTISSSTFVIDSKNFTRDVSNIEDEPDRSGSLHLVTLKVLIKEVANNPSPDNVGNLRSAVVIYRFAIRTVSYNSGDNIIYEISLVGAPNYEIIAKSDNLYFTMDLSVLNNNVKFVITNQSLTNNTYFVNGVDMDITRV